MKIMIAEDDLTSRIMLKAVLSKWDYEVLAMADGDEAWVAMQQDDAPQLLILDWIMPGMNGPELCQKLRDQGRANTLYIIMLTSKSERKDIIAGLEIGADDYITKPYDNDELRARIDVGKRMIGLQTKLREKEKLQGVIEMAGAVCHELNQPLQAVKGYAELLLMDTSENEPNYGKLKDIKDGADRIGQLTQKIMRISEYRTKGYMNNRTKIVDIYKASTVKE